MDHRIRTGDWLAGPSHLCSCQEDCFFKIWLAAFASSTLFTPAGMDFHNYRTLAKSLSALCLVPVGGGVPVLRSTRATEQHVNRCCGLKMALRFGDIDMHLVGHLGWSQRQLMAHATREVRTILDLRCD